MSGELPRPYRHFLKDYPQVAKAYEALGESLNAAGPLDARTRHLVRLGIATALQAEGAVKSHARQAQAAGATPEEIRHAVLLAMTTASFPRMIAALEWLREEK